MYRILDIIHELIYSIRRRIRHGKILDHDLSLNLTNESHYHICLAGHLFPRKYDFDKICVHCCPTYKSSIDTIYPPPYNNCEMCKYFATIWFEKDNMKIMCSEEVILKREEY